MATVETTTRAQSSSRLAKSPADEPGAKSAAHPDPQGTEATESQRSAPNSHRASNSQNSEAEGLIAAIEAMEQERPGKSKLAVVSLIVAALVAALLSAAAIAYFDYAAHHDAGATPATTTQN